MIRNKNGVKKAEQGQYQRYPSDSCPGEYRLIKEERKCERGDFYFFEKDRSEEVREAGARSR